MELPCWPSHRSCLRKDELESLLPCPLIKQFLQPVAVWTDAADLLAAGPLAIATGKQCNCLIPRKDPNEQLQALSEELRAIRGRELLVSMTYEKSCATQLLTTKGVATRPQLSELRQKLALQGVLWLAGCFDPELNPSNSKLPAQNKWENTPYVSTLLLAHWIVASSSPKHKSGTQRYSNIKSDPNWETILNQAKVMKIRRKVVPILESQIHPHRGSLEVDPDQKTIILPPEKESDSFIQPI